MAFCGVCVYREGDFKVGRERNPDSLMASNHSIKLISGETVFVPVHTEVHYCPQIPHYHFGLKITWKIFIGYYISFIIKFS